MSSGTLKEVGPFGDKGSILDAKTITAVWFAEVNATSGTVSAPTGGTLVSDRFASGVDALCSTITTTLNPDLEAPIETDGTPVFVSSFNTGTGAFVLSGDPSSFPVAVLFAYDVSLLNFDNTKNLVAVDLDETGELATVVTDFGTLGATLVMDMKQQGKAEFEAVTSADALTITITNTPESGFEGESTIFLDTTILPVSITFPPGTVDAPTITVGKVWELSFKTVDAGTIWRVIGKEWSS